MDDLENAVIKQYKFKKDGETIIITAILNKKTQELEFYGHLATYDNMSFLYGYDAKALNIKNNNFNNEIKNHAKLLAHDFEDMLLMKRMMF